MLAGDAFIISHSAVEVQTCVTAKVELDHIELKSAGVADSAVQTLTADLLEWADKIYVFEKKHRNKIHKKFPEIY